MHLSKLVLAASLLALAVFLVPGPVSQGTDKDAGQDEAALVQKDVALKRRSAEEADQAPFDPTKMATGMIPQFMYDEMTDGVPLKQGNANGMVPGMGGKMKLVHAKVKDRKMRKQYGSEAVHDKKDLAVIKGQFKALGPLAAMAMASELQDKKMDRLDKQAEKFFEVADGYGEDVSPEHLQEIRDQAKLDREILAAKKNQLGTFKLKEFMKKREKTRKAKELKKKLWKEKKANATKYNVTLKKPSLEEKAEAEIQRKAKLRADDLEHGLYLDKKLGDELEETKERLRVHRALAEAALKAQEEQTAHENE